MIRACIKVVCDDLSTRLSLLPESGLLEGMCFKRFGAASTQPDLGYRFLTRFYWVFITWYLFGGRFSVVVVVIVPMDVT